MILVLIGVAIAIIVLGVILHNILRYDDEWIGTVTIVIGVLVLIVALIACVCLCVDVSNLAVIDTKIEMYQEENTKIETQIAETVKQYQQYESDIFKDISPDSSITLVALYPELKSDTLVQKQIEVYMANNAKIKELKESKINGNVNRWWLYFGG